MDTFESGDVMDSRKKIRGSGHPELESALLLLFKQMCSENIAINGRHLKAKALDMTKLLNIDYFRESEGWLTWFKNWHGIFFKTVSGKAGNVLEEKKKEWKANLSCLLKGYDAKNVFNIDETGLFFIKLSLIKVYI